MTGRGWGVRDTGTVPTVPTPLSSYFSSSPRGNERRGNKVSGHPCLGKGGSRHVVEASGVTRGRGHTFEKYRLVIPLDDP